MPREVPASEVGRPARALALGCGLLLALVLTSGCDGRQAQAEAHAQAGIEAGRAGDLSRALESFDEALALDPTHLKALYNGGIALMGAGRGAEAAARFSRFLELRPDDALGHFYLGRASLQAGRKEAAVAALQRAVALGFSDWVEWKAANDLAALADDFRFAQLDLVIAQRAGEKFDASAPGEGYGGRQLPHAPFPAFQRKRACAPGSAILDGGAPQAGDELHACE